MKTYLIEKFKSLKSKIELLDQKAEIQKIEDEVKNILCKNPWHVFNDGDQNELYLFDENNTLSIIYSGKVTKAEWKYVKELKSVEITTKDQIYMLQMAWFENTDLLCMRLYGTDEYCFMIEDKKWDTCGFKQLSDVTNHILAIEKQKEQLRIVAAKRAEEQRQELKRQRIEKEKAKAKARREKERIKDAKKRLSVERKKWEEEAENLEEVQLLISKKESFDKYSDHGLFLLILVIILLVFFVCVIIFDDEDHKVLIYIWLFIQLLWFIIFSIFDVKSYKIRDKIDEIKTEYVKKKESEWCLQENIDF
ncbi:MAG: hypothetical protein J6U44_01570 [Paludibacteraceae bacterium]|nr:hypothetical protein [Paludibacteraceae bacterium]